VLQEIVDQDRIPHPIDELPILAVGNLCFVHVERRDRDLSVLRDLGKRDILVRLPHDECPAWDQDHPVWNAVGFQTLTLDTDQFPTARSTTTGSEDHVKG